MDWGFIGKTIGGGLLEVVLPGLGTIIAAQVVALLAKKAKKAGVELTEAQQERLRRIIIDSAKRVEEMGRREPLTGPQKRVAATDAALGEMRALLGPNVELSRDQVGKMLDTVLADVRTELGQSSATLHRASRSI